MAYNVIAQCCRMVLVVVVISLQPCCGYPDGAPMSTCINGFPKHHGEQQQTTTTPFRIDLAPQTYSPGSTVTVTLTSVTGTRDFIGFQVRAQAQIGDTESLVGSFPTNTLPQNAQGMHWYPVSVAAAPTRQPNCVTHNDNGRKRSVSLQWLAPAQDIGPVIFSAGIVEEFKVFWVLGNTKILPGPNPAYTPPTFPSSISNIFTPALQFDDECGSTKGCMLYPIGCSGNNCRFVVSYKSSILATGIEFEVSGESPGYLSLGFSDDRSMGKDLTTTCVHTSTHQSVQNGYNPTMHNERRPVAGITNIQLKRDGKRIMCRFTRQSTAEFAIMVTPTEISRVDFSFTKEWYIFLAYGDVYEGTNIPEKHDALPLISERKVDLNEQKVVGARSLYPVLQAHGSLGIIAWIALISLAILIARFYRQTLNSKVAGAAVWFQVHRALAVTGVVLSAIGVIAIFSYRKEWSDDATAHAVMGLIALTFATVQIVSGLLRPHPGTDNRVIFNWIHRSSGMLGFICAAICVLLAFQVSLIGDPLRLQGTVTVAVWLAFILVWFIVLQVLQTISEGKVDAVKSVTANGVSIQDPADTPNTDKWRKLHVAWLAAGGVITLALTVLMLFFINTA